MRTPSSFIASPAPQEDPIVEVVMAGHDPRAMAAMREAIAEAHRSLSNAARSLGKGAGMLSVEIGAGSRPRTHDATFVPRADYLGEAESGAEADHNARTVAAIDALAEGEFLLTVIAGRGFGTFRVRHAKGEAASEAPKARIADPVHLSSREVGRA